MIKINKKVLGTIIIGITLSFIAGIYAGHVLDEQTKFETLSYLIKFINDVTGNKEGSELTFIIFKNNLVVALTLVILGLTVILPFAVIFTNGLSIGVLDFATKRIFDIFRIDNNYYTIKATIVHGVPELSAIFLGAIIGIYFGIMLFNFGFIYIDHKFNNNPYRSIRKKMKLESDLNGIKDNFFLLIKCIMYIIVPLLIVAAILEVYVTPIVMMYGAENHNDLSNILSLNSTIKDLLMKSNNISTCRLNYNKTINYIDSGKILPYVATEKYYNFLKAMYGVDHRNKKYYEEFRNLIINNSIKTNYLTMQFNISLINKYYNLTDNFTLNDLNQIIDYKTNMSADKNYIVDTKYKWCLILSDARIECSNENINAITIVCE